MSRGGCKAGEALMLRRYLVYVRHSLRLNYLQATQANSQEA